MTEVKKSNFSRYARLICTTIKDVEQLTLGVSFALGVMTPVIRMATIGTMRGFLLSIPIAFGTGLVVGLSRLVSMDMAHEDDRHTLIGTIGSYCLAAVCASTAVGGILSIDGTQVNGAINKQMTKELSGKDLLVSRPYTCDVLDANGRKMHYTYQIDKQRIVRSQNDPNLEMIAQAVSGTVETPSAYYRNQMRKREFCTTVSSLISQGRAPE